MRDIKFRGKIKDKEDWVYGTLLIIPAPPTCIGEKKPDAYFIQFPNPRYMPDWNMPYNMVQAEVEPKTVGQYTGLHDKNGKEIYEGDIIKGLFNDQEEPEMIGIVTYSDCQASYIVIATNNDEWDLGFLDDIEVIGNIYENKDLLKERR